MKIILCVLYIWISMVSVGISMALENPAAQESSESKTVVLSNNEFALDLFCKLRKKEGNLFFSPFSISSALAMTYSGARGETASQMETALHFTLKEEELHRAFGTLTSSLNARGETGAYQLNVANALWGQKGIKFLDSFLELTRSSYDAGLNNVDFTGNPEVARQTINQWIEEKTMEKIKNLLVRGTVTPDTRLILTNAIYFKGNWAVEFDEDRTKKAPFYLTGNDSVQVAMMHQVNEYAYIEEDDLQVISMPYVNKELSMVILLPRKIDGLEQLEKNLTYKKLSGWISKLEEQKVILYLPKFKMTSTFNLNGPLESLGMTHAFKPETADFSGMTGRRDFFISVVVHKAFVDVNEEGTEAAAATAVVMRGTAVGPKPKPIPIFRADHPFIFLIRDNQTGSILFIGRLADPNA